MTDEDKETDWSDYDSGPFCRHWSDPADCDERCARCNHRCGRHAFGDGDSECMECEECLAWVEDAA